MAKSKISTKLKYWMAMEQTWADLTVKSINKEKKTVTLHIEMFENLFWDKEIPIQEFEEKLDSGEILIDDGFHKIDKIEYIMLANGVYSPIPTSELFSF